MRHAAQQVSTRNHLLLLLLSVSNVAAVVLAQLIVLASIGPGSATDAFMAAATIPQFFMGIASVAISGAVVPLLSGEPDDRQNGDAWFLVLVAGALFLVLAVVLNLTAEWWASILFPGFTESDSALCARLAGIQIFAVVFGGANPVVAAFCYARREFLRVEVATLFAAVFSIAFLYLFLPEYGIVAAAWGFVLTPVVQMLFLLPALAWPSRFDGAMRMASQAWSRIKPVLAGSLYHKSEVVVDRYLLSMAGAGEMTLFSLAQQVFVTLAGVIGKVWGNTAIPGLSVFAKQNDRTRFGAHYRRHLILLFAISGGAYVAFLWGGQFALSQLVGLGKISAEDTASLSLLMTCMGGVLVFGSLGVLISGAFYAMGDMRTPTIVSVASFTLFIVLKFFAFRHFGAMGVALAASGYYALNAIVLASILHRVLRRRGLSEKWT